MRYTIPNRRPLAVFFCLSSVLSLLSTVSAAVVTWDGGGGDTSWHTANNWNPDGVPGAADDVTINIGANPTITHTTGTTTINSLSCDEDLVLSAPAR